MEPFNIDTGPAQQKFQVTLSFEISDAFMALVPAHRTYINYLINKNIIDSYSVSLEVMRSWIIINGSSKNEIYQLLQHSPLYSFWTIEVDELNVVDGQPYRLPALQPN